jgi:nucleotide-binding universal stress UspA family protein
MYKRAVIPLDGSPVAEAILPMVLDIAGPLDMEVVLLRVVLPLTPIVIEGARHIVVEALEAQHMDAVEYLAALAVELRNKGIRVETFVRRGIASDEILAAARETAADLIAMTTHGRSGLGRLLFGSVAEEVLRRSDIPVFLMRCTEADVARRTIKEAVA